ncbi:MAG: phenylalanine--tRNA ligase subunit beta [Nitrospinae bacterium]|nr:phenylalanine--tRNA ligase subunit beta [Nitrospinota bacterium]
MRISLEWLADYIDLHLEDAELPERLANGLLLAGLEVEALERPEASFDGLVVAEVLSVEAHPNADRLKICRVTDGAGERSVVCGAPNVAAGQRVVLATPGVRMPGGVKVEVARIRGERSEGMICSEREIGLGADHSGIMVLDNELAIGSDAAEILGLNDVIFDISITPNRADCLSVLGVAREAAALLGTSLRTPEISIQEDESVSAASVCAVEIWDPDKCPRYAARIIQGVEIGPSPAWMARRLRAAGMRPINNVVDVTNYVMLSLGQPLHAFDLHRLAEHKIIVRRWAESDGPFTTLDGQQREMDDEDLMICDGEKPVAIGGVMGGLYSEVSDDTRDILLESAYFTPQTIRRTRRRLGMSTEASYRFERGVDPSGTVRAADLAAEFIRRTAGGAVARGAVDAHPAPIAPKQVPIRVTRASSLLGVSLDAARVRESLESLGLLVNDTGDGVFSVEVPTFRPDIEREIDLIEEVGRRVGYENIPATLPISESPAARPTRTRSLELKARRIMVAGGFSEAINYSFVSREALRSMGWLDEQMVELRNPLSGEMDVLRSTLLAGLLANVAHNLSRGVGEVRLFELGRSFHPVNGEALPDQVLRLAGVIVGSAASKDGVSLPGALSEQKGVLERFLESLGLDNLRFAPADAVPGWEPSAVSKVLVGEMNIGHVGLVAPEALGVWDIETGVAAFEINLAALAEIDPAPRRLTPLPRYPASLRDLAVVVDAERTNGEIEAIIRQSGGDWLESVNLFDVYQDAALKASGEKSLAYSLVFRHPEATLTDEQVSVAFDGIVGALGARLNARLRS